MPRRFDSTSVFEFHQRFPDDNACLSHVARTRFGDPPTCPRCGIGTELSSYKRMHQLYCKGCYSVISIKAGTVFASSTIPLKTWFYLLLLCANRTTGLSTAFVCRHLGLHQHNAFRVLSIVRAHMAALMPLRRMGADGSCVQIDETWLPGIKATENPEANGVIVFGLHDARGVQTFIVPNRSKRTLLPIIERLVVPGATIVSDQFKSYETLAGKGFTHIRLNHSRGEWVNADGYSMLGIEGYWANLKYFMRSNNRHPKQSNLPGYLAEHCFRFNIRRRGLCPFEALIASFPELDRQTLTPSAQRNSNRKATP